MSATALRLVQLVAVLTPRRLSPSVLRRHNHRGRRLFLALFHALYRRPSLCWPLLCHLPCRLLYHRLCSLLVRHHVRLLHALLW